MTQNIIYNQPRVLLKQVEFWSCFLVRKILGADTDIQKERMRSENVQTSCRLQTLRTHLL